MQWIRSGARATVLVAAALVAGSLALAPPAGAAVGTLNLTSICTFSGGPYDGQHLWRVTSTFAADEGYTSRSPHTAAPVARTSSPGKTWFLGAQATTIINYTNDSGPQQVTKAANGNTCTGPGVTITTPADGATYAKGQSVAADFACTGVELVSCVGTVPDGVDIDTASVGTKTFEVTATAWDGGTATASATYEVIVSNPAAASTCTFVPPPGPAVTSAQISWYPANPGAMSGLEVACVLRNDTGNNMVSPSFTIHDADTVAYHNGAARTVTTAAVTAPGSTTIQLATAANGIAGLPVAPTQMNRIISGTGLAPGTFVTSMTAGGLLALSGATAAPIPAGTPLKIENASARSVADATSSGTDVLSSATANFTAADVGLSVSGTGVPPFTTIAAWVSPTQVQLSNPWPGGGLAGPEVSIGESLQVSTARQITGVTTTSAVKLSSPTGLGSFVASDIGLKVTGTCTQLTASAADDTVIPPNTYIVATPSQANADTTGGLTAGWSGCTIVVGEANANAPIDGEVVASKGVQLNLDPSVIAGVDECSNEQAEGFALVGRWYNPGSFQGIGVSNQQPGPTAGSPATPATKAVGQVVFDTPAGWYSAFVVERKTLTAGDPQAAVHYDVVFPFVPVSLAMCPSSAGSPGLGFLLDLEATTASQSAAPLGAGRPGTNQVRSVELGDGSAYASYVFVDSQATPFTPDVNFRRLCLYPGAPSPVNFQCGAG